MAAADPRNRAWWPVAVLVTAFLALGGVGTAAGAALGAVGAASTGLHQHHHDDGPGRGFRPGGR
jgi:hypothetical protein